MILDSTRLPVTLTRQRSTGGVLGTTTCDQSWSDGGYSGSFDQSFYTPKTSEVISWERGTHYYKTCYHYKRKSTSTSLGGDDVTIWQSPTVQDNYENLNLGAIGQSALQSYGLYDPTHSSGPDVAEEVNPFTPQQLEDLLALGLRELIPKVDQWTEEFSLLNFLFELKDIPEMFKFWTRGGGLRKNLSGLVLNYELGWKPFLADCERIFNKVLTLKEKIDKWNEDAAAGKVYTRHANITREVYRLTGKTTSYSVHDQVLLNYNPGVKWDPITGSYLGSQVWTERMIEERGTFLVHMYFKPQPIPTRWLEDELMIWYDGLGLGHGAKVIWNAIPFSFVVDWFGRVDDFLGQFIQRTVDVGYELVDFGYSWKHRILKHYQPYQGYGQGLMNNHCLKHLGVHTEDNSLYIRRRAHPPLWRLDETDWSVLTDWRLPTWKQCWVGLNLLSANL